MDQYADWVAEVAAKLEKLSARPLPESLKRIRTIVDELFSFTASLQSEAPALNDLLAECAALEEDGALTADLAQDMEQLRDGWAAVCKHLDDR